LHIKANFYNSVAIDIIVLGETTMRLGFGLNLEQTQKLIMTPQLRQAITVLQLSALELSDYIEESLTENPMLDLKEESPSEPEPEEKGKSGEEFDVDWQEYFADRSDLGYTRYSRETAADSNSFENYLSQAPSLHEHLRTQLWLNTDTPRERKIGEFLIGSIDDNGYLRITVTEASGIIGATEAEVEHVLTVIQGFEPTGVGARDLVECLLIQLAQAGDSEPVMEKMVRNHLEDLAAGRFHKIAGGLGLSLQKVQALADRIKSLDPKPGRTFGGRETRYVVPDIVVERVSGEYVIIVNDSGFPRLSINAAYQAILGGKGFDPETRRFVEAKLNAAAWLIRSIEQRRMTLFRVATCIVNMQRDFLDRGLKCLKPLNLRQVAEAIGVHESTVCRAVANKFIQTPQGMFELKFFFNSGVCSGAGDMMSSQSVKKVIKEMVEKEDPNDPLSDQRIAERLNQQGIQISRRTVAKYRRETGLATTSQRRRY